MLNLRLRLMQGQQVLIENVESWEMNESGLEVILARDSKESQLHFSKRHWYNKSYIATLEEEYK